MENTRLLIGLVVSIAGIMLWPRLTRLHPFFGLLAACLLFAVVAGLPLSRVPSIMQTGMGNLLGQIAAVIALGSVLGTLLDKTGAMAVICHALLRISGRKHPVLSIGLMGALVGIPVFCDSGFIILSRLLPPLAAETAASQGSLTLALAGSLYTTHTLVPPTPGPFTAAVNLGLAGHMGLMMVTGLLVTIPVVAIGTWVSARKGDMIQSDEVVPHVANSTRPGLAQSLLPLFVPILLIAATSLESLTGESGVLRFLGHPAIALLIGVVLAMPLLKGEDRTAWPGWIQEALKEAGVILLVTGAGGALGALIKEAGMAGLVEQMAVTTPYRMVGFLVIGWLISALLKTAQGSSTSAMVVTSSLLVPLAPAAGFTDPIALSVLVAAIGGGSMAVSHSNDSYFWVVSQFGGFSPAWGFRNFTVLTLIQGVTALAACLLLLYFAFI